LARVALTDGKAPMKNAGYVTPVLANGRLYCRVAAGKLVCLDVRKH
jgi:hypothetical protein